MNTTNNGALLNTMNNGSLVNTMNNGAVVNMGTARQQLRGLRVVRDGTLGLLPWMK